MTLLLCIRGCGSPLAAWSKVGYRKRTVVRKYEPLCVTRDRWYPLGRDIGPTSWAPPLLGPFGHPFPWALHEGQPQYIHYNGCRDETVILSYLGGDTIAIVCVQKIYCKGTVPKKSHDILSGSSLCCYHFGDSYFDTLSGDAFVVQVVLVVVVFAISKDEIRGSHVFLDQAWIGDHWILQNDIKTPCLLDHGRRRENCQPTSTS